MGRDESRSLPPKWLRQVYYEAERALHGPVMDRAARRPVEPLIDSPGLQLIYETAPIGLAFLSTDCRYLMINQHLTEICGISIADHLGHTVRETVPQVAHQ